MTYSLDFRQKVFEQKAKHDLTFEQTSERFGIGIATLFRWQKKLIPCVMRNKPSTKIDDCQLLEDVKNYPDDYQWERAERFGVTQRAIGLALKRLGISYKKKHCTIPRPTTRHVSTSNRKYAGMKRKEKPVFMSMKVALLKICPAPMVIPNAVIAVLAGMIGIRREE